MGYRKGARQTGAITMDVLIEPINPLQRMCIKIYRNLPICGNAYIILFFSGL